MASNIQTIGCFLGTRVHMPKNNFCWFPRTSIEDHTVVFNRWDKLFSWLEVTNLPHQKKLLLRGTHAQQTTAVRIMGALHVEINISNNQLYLFGNQCANTATVTKKEPYPTRIGLYVSPCPLRPLTYHILGETIPAVDYWRIGNQMRRRRPWSA